MKSVFPEALWVPLPSIEKDICRLVGGFGINRIILSGGEDLECNTARDITELSLIEWCGKNYIPLLGVCRGMQLINHYCGGKVSLNSSPEHVACRHKVDFVNSSAEVFQTREVNSYHSNVINHEMLAPDVAALAYDEVGNVEALCSLGKPFLGVMWHPEREDEPDIEDVKLIKSHFCD